MAADIAPVSGEITFDVPECSCCGGSHSAMTARPLHAKRAPFTHWFQCPNKCDPVMLTLMMQDDNPIEVNRRVMQDVAQSQVNGGPVLFATFGIDARNGVTLTRHCSHFPTNRMEEAVRLLHENLKAEMPLADDSPLPRANMETLLGRAMRENSPTRAIGGNGSVAVREDDGDIDEVDSDQQ